MSEQLQTYNYANTIPAGEQEWGFDVQELSPEQRISQPVENILVSNDEAKVLADKYVSEGAVKVLSAEDHEDVRASYFSLYVDTKELGHRLPGITKARSTYADVEAAELGLHEAFAEEEQAAIRERSQRMVYDALDRPYNSIPRDCLESADTLNQLFRIDNGRGEAFNIMNFSQTPLTGMALKKVVNAFREMDQLTGGASTRSTEVVAIFPDTLARWSNAANAEAQALGAKRSLATVQGDGTMLINEHLLKEQASDTHYDEAANKGDFSVAGIDIEPTIFHELEHMLERTYGKWGSSLPGEALGWNQPRTESGFVDFNTDATFEDEIQNPSQYGATDIKEDMAESAAAMFVGGRWANALDDGRKRAITKLYADEHTGIEGPAFIRCQEVDMAAFVAAGHKLGTELTSELVIKPDFTYYVKTS